MRVRPLFLFESNDDTGQIIESPVETEIEETDPVKRAILRSQQEAQEESQATEIGGDVDEQEESEEEVQGYYGGKFKTLEDFEKAHREFEQRFHAENQKIEDEDEEEEDPYAEIRQLEFKGFANPEPKTWEELGALIEQDSEMAAGFVLRNQDIFSSRPEVINFVLERWAKDKPVSYSQWYLQAERQRMQQEMMGQLTPIIQKYEQEKVTNAYKQVEQFPHYATVRVIMQNMINDNPNLITAADFESEDSLVKAIKNVHRLAIGEYVLEHGSLPVQAGESDAETEKEVEEEKPKRKRAVSQTGSRQSADSENGSKDKTIARAILEAGRS